MGNDQIMEFVETLESCGVAAIMTKFAPGPHVIPEWGRCIVNIMELIMKKEKKENDNIFEINISSKEIEEDNYMNEKLRELNKKSKYFKYLGKSAGIERIADTYGMDIEDAKLFFNYVENII